MAAGGLRPGQLSSRQRGIKPQRKNAGGRKSEQHPYHPHPKPSSVQSAVGGAHQESVSTATNEHLRIHINLPNKPRLRGMSHRHHVERGAERRVRRLVPGLTAQP